MIGQLEIERKSLEKKAEFLRVLGHPERLAIVILTMEKEVCVKDLVDILKISQPKVSQHVGLMKELGILSFRKEGTKVLYRTSSEIAKEIISLLFD
ncbi:ArsR family transcriptional regulator [Balnearium lithotrophicum]|uniref:ArsR family transcriptional regulator n=1 Tax=Balnearium lithotrophicum TaxID=223788 RepID=A0A521DA73_9BACT|nr:metalloregulator ArsR/SmtB family transcription factor [Balnearium lithotrophicum]SMO68609.1 ArsR family transcriptional regulator [Balnearium lithotrophicum]